jgi:hypothetical protein
LEEDEDDEEGGGTCGKPDCARRLACEGELPGMAGGMTLGDCEREIWW